MKHLVEHRKLGRTYSHRKALLRHLATALILRERIETTLPKAKELRGVADRLITWGKQGDLAARRQAARLIADPKALAKLFNGLSARFKERQGGYTRIIRYGLRRGDAAPMAAIEYLGYELPAAEKKPAKKEKKETDKSREVKVRAAKSPAKESSTKESAPEKKHWLKFGRNNPK